MSMDKQGPYTTVQRGGQNNYLQISETVIMQSYDLGRPLHITNQDNLI